MLWRHANASTPPTQTVWLLGNHHPDADKSIPWHAEFPDFGDPDVLIVDMTTLTEHVLEQIATKLDRAHKSIRDKFLSGGTVIIITRPHFSVYSSSALPIGRQSYSNYYILPVTLTTVAQAGARIKVGDENTFKEYVKSIESFSFYIKSYGPQIDPESFGGDRKVGLAPLIAQGIEDYSKHDLGLTLILTRLNGKSQKMCLNEGRLVFLPPPTEPINDAIGKILPVYEKKPAHAEAPPAWTRGLAVGPADEWAARIAELEGDKSKMQESIDRLKRQKEGVLAHLRLLYSKGAELEEAVVKAFKVMGFDDIEPVGGADKEDAVFEMNDGLYSRGVIEVKGADKRTQLQHILQCNRWTDLWAETDGRLTRGIFVPNQHRLEHYPKSLNDRIKFEPNHIAEAERKDICIIPSCVLFEAARRVLDGKAPVRAAIARKIAATKGVLTDVF